MHEDALATDPYVGDPARGGPGVTDQVAVLSGRSGPATEPSVAAALVGVRDLWAAPDGPAGSTYVIAIGDDARYTGDLAVQVPAASRLVLVAADWSERLLGTGETLEPVPGSYAPQGLRPHLQGTLRITGDGGSSVLLDGLVIEGDVVIAGGELGSLTVSQCTVAGSVQVGLGAPTAGGLQARLVRSVCEALRFGPAAANLRVCDSIVDAVTGPAADDPGDGVAISGAGLALDVQASTVRGGIAVRTLEASSAVLDGRVEVEHRQTGCVRFSYVQPGSRVPRRFRCVPDPQAREGRRFRPAYASSDPGSPQYLALGRACAPELVTGGEGGSEMGAHHHLYRPVRLAATARLLAPYLPAGLDISVAASLAATTGTEG